MGTKVNLAMQNQYVEFAKKDGEGNDIAEGIAKVKEDIDDLQEALENVVAFDGVIDCGAGQYAIPANTFSTTKNAGIYKLVNTAGTTIGVCTVLRSGANTYNITYMYAGGVYSASNIGFTSAYTIPTEADEVMSKVESLITGGTLSNAKPIYWHSLDIYKGGSTLLRGVILNNTNTPISGMSSLIAWLESIGDVDLIVNGGYTDPQLEFHSNVVSIRHTANSDYVTFYYVVSTGGYSSVSVSKTDLLAQEINVSDRSNRIN